MVRSSIIPSDGDRIPLGTTVVEPTISDHVFSRRTSACQGYPRIVIIQHPLIALNPQAPPPPTAIRQAVADYIEFLKIDGRARKTPVRYQGELNNLRDFLEPIQVTRLAQIAPTHFDKFRAHCKILKHGPRTLFHESVVVKQWLKWCQRRHLAAVNLLADYKLIKPALEPRDGPSLEQVNAILTAARGPRKIQYPMLAFTGMRSGELQRLKCEDVELKMGWIKIVS